MLGFTQPTNWQCLTYCLIERQEFDVYCVKLYNRFMVNENHKFNISWKWLGFFIIALIFLSVSIFFIMQADFLADNIKFLPDDPYIYWIFGWVLFVISFISFSVSSVNLVQKCVQYLKMKDYKKE